jgi:murein DD-endopeptidase MepM/ murein hydrolase activator NlpD
MLRRLPAFISLPLIICSLWFCASTYRYFFDRSCPTVTLIGLEQNGHYRGNIDCIIKGQDDYKVRDITILLDGKPVSGGYHKINKKKFQYPISLDNLKEGAHTLSLELLDASYSENRTKEEFSFVIDNQPLEAAFTKQEYKAFQGRTIHLQIHVNKQVASAQISVLSTVQQCFPESEGSTIYECFIPVAWDTQPNEYPFQLILEDRVKNSIRLEGNLQVLAFPFTKQIITVDPKKIALEAEAGENHKELEEALKSLTAQSPDKKLWQGVFYVPLELKKITTEYGTLRISQDRGIRAHTALDLVGKPRGVVWASQDGNVVLKGRYALSGNTIVIDHGCGILSLYYHLDSFAAITVGDTIKKGNPVGTEGMTGYANGYHLHWEIRVNNIPVDPMQWTKNDF